MQAEPRVREARPMLRPLLAALLLATALPAAAQSPGAGAPSNANLHLRLAADDRFHHRGQCILNRTTIATSSVRRVM